MDNSNPCRQTPVIIDKLDWLKTAAIIFVSVDHIGYFFIEDADWWSVIGRLAAPIFFFLLGYAHTRTVPLHWVWLAAILTLLDCWNNEWTWLSANILFSFALIRIVRPYMLKLLQRHRWTAFVLLVTSLVALLPVAGSIVDYGTEGWLWALFGLCQRIYIDKHSVNHGHDNTKMPLLAATAAAVAYLWQEQIEFAFPHSHFVIFLIGVSILSLLLYLFQPGQSQLQAPRLLASAVRFTGRHTLEIYASQLVGFELLIMLIPDLAA